MDERHENTDLMSSALVSTAAGFPINAEIDPEDPGLRKSQDSILRNLLIAITPRILRISLLAELKRGARGLKHRGSSNSLSKGI